MGKTLKRKRFCFGLICLSFFFVLVILILKKGVLDIDKDSYLFIKNNIINSELTPFVKVLTNLGGALVLISISFILIFIIQKKKINIAIFLNLLISSLINELIKFIVRRNRPLIDNWLIMESGYSFPSGHAMTSMAFYGFLIYLVYVYIKDKKYKYWLITVLSTIILLVGISRVYLGVHYLSDILAGFFISIVYLIIFIYFYNKFTDSTNS